MATRHVRLATALLATTAIGLGAIEIQANLTARAQLRQLLAQHHGLAVAGIFAEPLTGRLRLHGVQAGRGEIHFTIGALDLPMPRPSLGLISAAVASPFNDKPDEATPDEAKPDDAKPDDATPEAKPETPAAPTADIPAASGDTATAENVTITKGTTTYHIKRIDLTGGSISSADLAKLVDPNSPESIEARVKKLTATTISIPEVLIDDPTAGSEFHGSMTQIVLKGANAGKIATGSIGGLSGTSKSGTENLVITVAGAQAAGIDLVQIAHVFNSTRTDDAEPILPLYDSVTVTGIKVANEAQKSNFTLASLKETGLKARAFGADVTTASKSGAKLTPEQQTAAYEDLTRSLEIGSLEATGMTVHGTDSTTFTLASMSMQDFAKAKVGGFIMRDMTVEAPKVKFGLGSFEVGPFALPPPKGTTTSGSNPMVPSTAKADLNKITLDVDAPASETGGAATHVAFNVAHVGFQSDGDPGDLPKTSKTTIENITFDIPANPGQAQPLVDMGYRHLDISAGLVTTYDPAAQTLNFEDLTLNGVNMGSLAISLHLANVTKGLVSSNQEVVKASALAILAKGIKFYLSNDGLIDKVLAWKAKQDGMGLDKEKEVLVDFFDNKLPASLNNSANVKIVGAAVAKFIANPKNLYLGAISKSGLGVGSMALLSDPGQLIDTLDVKAIANQ